MHLPNTNQWRTSIYRHNEIKCSQNLTGVKKVGAENETHRLKANLERTYLRAVQIESIDGLASTGMHKQMLTNFTVVREIKGKSQRSK